MSNAPIAKTQLSTVKVNTWQNVRDEKSYTSISVEKSYKKDGEWKTMKVSFDLDEAVLLQAQLKAHLDAALANRIAESAPSDESDYE